MWLNRKLLLLSPLVLATNLVLLLGSEVILDVEGLANLFGRLALDHVGNSLAADVEKSFDIEVVGSLHSSQLSLRPRQSATSFETYQDDLEKHLLVNLHELLVPLIDIRRLAAGVVLVTGAGRVVLVVSTPFDDLLQDRLVDLCDLSQYVSLRRMDLR